MKLLGWSWASSTTHREAGRLLLPLNDVIASAGHGDYQETQVTANCQSFPEHSQSLLAHCGGVREPDFCCWRQHETTKSARLAFQPQLNKLSSCTKLDVTPKFFCASFLLP